MKNENANARLENIYKFLVDNRQYNEDFQERYIRSIIRKDQSSIENLTALLYSIANTQSKPSIDDLAIFFKKFNDEKCKIKSFYDFLLFLSPKKCEKKLSTLFMKMKMQNGWGEKTAALFTKIIFLIHTDHRYEDVKIWNDVPSKLIDKDRIYLPVDRVIKNIFRKIGFEDSFSKINKVLDCSGCTDIIVWDDLWFWGFFSYNKSDLKWNEEKYFCTQFSDKEIHKIIENLSKEFICIIENNSHK